MHSGACAAARGARSGRRRQPDLHLRPRRRRNSVCGSRDPHTVVVVPARKGRRDPAGLHRQVARLASRTSARPRRPTSSTSAACSASTTRPPPTRRGDWFTFEKGATKTTGGEGWADVWRKGCFGWEYKGYGTRTSTPPTASSSATRSRSRTRRCSSSATWTASSSTPTGPTPSRRPTPSPSTTSSTAPGATSCAPPSPTPSACSPTKTREALTAEAAAQFAALAQRLRDRGHDAAGRRPLRQPPRLLHVRRGRRASCPTGSSRRCSTPPAPTPPSFAANAATLFAAMRTGGRVGFTRVDWFNGGLFDDDAALPLDRADIDDLIEAARLDWCQIDPSILGTLFERGLDPAKRSQLGAHYTDRDKIMKIVNPVIVEPLLAEWAEAQGRDRGRPRPREGRRSPPAAATRAHNERAARCRAAFLERLQGLPRPRPRLRLRQLPLPRPARAQGHRAPRQRRGRGPRPPPRLPRRRPRGGARHRAQPLRRRARPRLGLDRRDPVDARQRLRRRPQPDPPPARHHRMPRRHPERGRHPRRLARGRRGGRQPAVPGRQADARRPRRRLRRRALRAACDGIGAPVRRPRLLLVRAGRRADRAGAMRRAGLVATNSIRGGANREVAEARSSAAAASSTPGTTRNGSSRAPPSASRLSASTAATRRARALDGVAVAEINADLTRALSSAQSISRRPLRSRTAALRFMGDQRAAASISETRWRGSVAERAAQSERSPERRRPAAVAERRWT